MPRRDSDKSGQMDEISGPSLLLRTCSRFSSFRSISAPEPRGKNNPCTGKGLGAVSRFLPFLPAGCSRVFSDRRWRGPRGPGPAGTVPICDSQFRPRARERDWFGFRYERVQGIDRPLPPMGPYVSTRRSRGDESGFRYRPGVSDRHPLPLYRNLRPRGFLGTPGLRQGPVGGYTLPLVAAAVEKPTPNSRRRTRRLHQGFV